MTPSDDSSVISGDDEAGWAKEEAKVIAMVRKQNADEEKEAEQLEDEEVMEFYDFEPDDAADDENPVFVSIEVTRKAATINKMKELYQMFHLPLPSDKRKPSLFDTLRDSDKVTKIDVDTFTYQAEQIPFSRQKGPKWEILTGIDIQLPDGFHPSGVEEGFFAPTNQENAVGAQKKNYLMQDNEKIKRPEFEFKPTKTKSSTDGGGNAKGRGRPKQSSTAPRGPPSKKGGPASEYA